MRLVTVCRGVLCTFVYLIFSSHGFAQSVEDPDYIKERITAHGVTVSPTKNVLSRYKGIEWLVTDVKRGELNGYGPDFEVENAEAIAAIQRFDRSRIGQDAIEPYFTEMCHELRAGTSDVTSLAELLSEAEAAEKSALAQAYGDIEKVLSSNGKTAVATILKESTVQLSQFQPEAKAAEIAAHTRAQLKIEGFPLTSDQAADDSKAKEPKVRRLDYVGLASDVPEFTRGLITRACRRHEEIANSKRGSSERPSIEIEPNSGEGPFIQSSKPSN